MCKLKDPEGPEKLRAKPRSLLISKLYGPGAFTIARLFIPKKL